MYLIDTNVVSKLRKKSKMDAGVKAFFKKVALDKSELYLSVITIGELHRGVEQAKHRGYAAQAKLLEQWLHTVLEEFSQNILVFGQEEAQLWGKLRFPHYENAIDKQIAAKALIYDMALVTRNIGDFIGTGVRVINLFEKT